MKKIGICFPQSDFLSMKFDEFKKYILMFKQAGLYSFDMFTSLLINNHKNINELLSFLNDNDIKITFHYNGKINNDGILDDDKSDLIIRQYQEDLIKVRHKLQACDINYHTSVVFHALNYKEEYQKHNHLIHQIDIFKNVCKLGETINFDILVEILSYNHPMGNHLGDDYYELEKMINDVNYSNFGICWDIGHTRLNHLEEYSGMLLPENIVSKVKFTHIHNYSKDDGIHKVIDHLPLINRIYKDNELKYLLENNYEGIYSLEISTNNLIENINIYINSINILKESI